MAKQKTLDDCIRQLLNEGMFVPIYFVSGINVLKNRIDEMSDKEICKEFCGLFDPQMVRNDVDHIFTTLNEFIKKKN